MRRRYLPVWCFICIFAMLLSVGCRAEDEEIKLEEAVVQEEDPAESPAENTHIFVYVCGCVNAPGVYELLPDSRLYEAIEAAGGMTEEAAAVCLNQAEKLTDGQKIYVPSVEEAAVPEGQGQSDDGRLNLNTATKEELMTLPGIGEVKAEAIIRYREEKGSFASVEELKEVEGIKEGVFEKVKDQIKVS